MHHIAQCGEQALRIPGKASHSTRKYEAQFRQDTAMGLEVRTDRDITGTNRGIEKARMMRILMQGLQWNEGEVGNV